MSKSPLTALEIRFQTAPNIPPPYAHFYTLSLQQNPTGSVNAEFSLTYTDRDEVEEDEIIGEGFTEDDDFSWLGELAPVWLKTVEDLTAKTRFEPLQEEKLGQYDDYLAVRVEARNGENRNGAPNLLMDWKYLAQELMQAVYETAGKERPFELKYKETAGDNTTEMQLTAYFSKRETTLRLVRNGRVQSRTLAWHELKTLMEVLFTVDFSSEEPMPKLPRREGKYLSIGDEGWYDLPASSPDGDRSVKRLLQELNRLTA